MSKFQIYKSHILNAWVPAALWLGIIAWESIALSSDRTSSFLIPILHWLFPHLPMEQLQTVHDGARKTGHFVGYAVLSLLVYRAWWLTVIYPELASLRRLKITRGRLLRSLWNARSAVLALLSTVLVAALDEAHQSTNPNRTGTWKDVLLDFAGGCCAQLLILAVSRSRIRLQRNSRRRLRPPASNPSAETMAKAAETRSRSVSP